MASIRTLAAELGADIVEVREYLYRTTGDNPGTDAPLYDDEEEAIRYHWGDGAPQEQYRAADGAPDAPWHEE